MRGARLWHCTLCVLLAGCDGCADAPPPLPARSVPPPPLPAPAAASASASGSPAARKDPGPVLPRSELTWRYDESPVGRTQVVVSLPPRYMGQRFPVLIAMHGRGEALKGPEKGARGWIDDYWLPRADDRLRTPPLLEEDFRGFVESDRLDRLNQGLEKRPFAGLIVVCPYTPDILAGDRPFGAAEPLAKFLVDELLQRVRRETPAQSEASATGIDGVSLGGRASLLVGLLRPEAFGVVATLQPAFDSADAPEIARRVAQAREKNPKLKLSLLTSTKDYFLAPTRAISKALTEGKQEHRLRVVPGPHDYDFNRGPGAIEMLAYHDRVLRGLPPDD